MLTEKLNTKELFASFDDTASELLQVVSSFNEKEINTAPFKDSWTAAQVAEHVTRSNNSIIKSLELQGETTERNPAEGAEGLKKTFLDFTTKLKSPKFILPTQSTYSKEMIIADLKKSLERLKEVRDPATLSEVINHPVFGDVTKLELLYFVMYHTQRHIHQLKNIFKKLDNE